MEGEGGRGGRIGRGEGEWGKGNGTWGGERYGETGKGSEARRGKGKWGKGRGGGGWWDRNEEGEGEREEERERSAGRGGGRGRVSSVVSVGVREPRYSRKTSVDRHYTYTASGLFADVTKITDDDTNRSYGTKHRPHQSPTVTKKKKNSEAAPPVRTFDGVTNWSCMGLTVSKNCAVTSSAVRFRSATSLRIRRINRMSGSFSGP